jgi:cellulose synthase/poly-beta-1,6-N-acetylglucosamine synthase-like glycosyltransferase
MAVLDALWFPIMGIYTLVLGFFLCVGLNLLFMTLLAAWRRPRHAKPGPLDHFPRVTVQLPIFNELYVVERLVKATCGLDWPQDRLQIQVLDDSTDETQFIVARLVRRCSEQGFNISHVRRPDREGFKAGALEAGLREADGEFIAVFDADFVPPPAFLKETIPYFGYERVGFVQARWGHLNQSYSLLTELQSVIIDAHFFVDQVARNRGGFFMNFNGTAGVWRRAAIEDAGGWEHDTLAEDLDLSYRAQLRGWEAVYLPDLVVDAELPVTVSAYRAQQRRWAAGSLACAIKLLPKVLHAPISVRVKLQAVLHLVGYGSHACLLVMFLLQPFLLTYSARYPQHASMVSVSPFWLLVATVPALAPGIYLGYAQWRANKRIATRIPYIFGASVLGAGIMLTVVSALARTLFGKPFAFERTPKYGIANQSDSWDGKRYALGLDPVLALEMLLACFSFGSIAYAVALKSWSSFFYMGYFLIGLLFIIATSFVQLNVPAVPHVLASSTPGNRES